MAKKKQTEEQEVVTKAPAPIGFTAKNETNPIFTFEQFFSLMRIADALNNFVNFTKQENFNADNIRYYFPDDLVEVFDKEGNPVMVKNQKGELVQDKQLRADFWNNTPPVEEVK